MFREILENMLEFIGSHSEEYGCTGTELLSFVSMDVLPYYTLPQHTTLQQTVMDLLVNEGGDFTVKRCGKPQLQQELTGSLLPYNECIFYPTITLQERVLGISLQRKNIRAAVNFACDHLLRGFRRYQHGSKSDGGNDGGGQRDRRGSKSGVGSGIRQLLREQWLRLLYVYESRDVPLTPYLMPHFAIPPPHAHTRRQPLRPLEAYLARRREQLQPPRIVIDVNLVRRILLSSPERRLVLADAIHAIFAAHGHDVPAVDGRTMCHSFKRMFTACGLRVVRASIMLKHRARTVQVVVVDSTKLPSECEKKNNSSDDDDDVSATASAAADDADDDDDDVAAKDDGDDRETVSSDDVSTTAAAEHLARRVGDIFCVDPSYPLGLQVVKEAERHPLVVDSVLPRVTLYDQRSISKDLHRFIHQYEQTWGTIEGENVLSRHCKAFTRLLKPKDWDDMHRAKDGVNETEVADASLPKGVSQWSVNTVMEALRAAPLQALFLPGLTQIVDRRTLGRLLPYLRDEGRITTTGVTLSGEKRIGVVALAGVEMTAELRAALAQAYADYRAARHQKQQELNVVLQRLPEPADGGQSRSLAASGIAKSTARSVSLVSRVTMVRNGYSRVGLFRISRLHLELCRVWWILGRAPEVPLTVERVLQEMSLSSFCIIIGIADVDVSEYVGAASSAEMGCRWKTPIRLLPPTLQEHCRRSGMQPLLHSLSGLQSEGLVVCDQRLTAYLNVPLSDLSIALVAVWREGKKDGDDDADDDNNNNRWRPRRDHQFFFKDEVNTPDRTCCAVLKYWKDRWETFTPRIHVSRHVVALVDEVIATEPNLSNVQIIALSRLLRIDCGVLAEHILQRQGIVRGRRRTLRHTIQAGKRPRKNANTRGGPRRRLEVNGAAVAEALEAVMQSDEPSRDLARLCTLLQRQGKPLQQSVYNPYYTPIYGSMQTLVQSIMSTLDNQADPNAAPAVAEMAVASVVSPNFAAPPDIGATMKSRSESAARRKRAESPKFTAAAKDPHENEPSEVLQDIMRMILLTDEAHYDAFAASALLAQFSHDDRRHCIDWLLMFPAFRMRSGGPGRLPRIELSPSPTLLPATVVAGVMHRQNAMAVFAQDVATELLLTPKSKFARWCVPPVSLGECVGEGKWVHRAPRLVQQPSLDLDSLSEEIREQKGLGALRLPRFAWPTRPLEAPPPPPPPPSSSVEQHPLAPSHCAPATPAAAAASSPMMPTTLESAQHTAELYPARSILRSWRRLQHLELRDIPVDDQPTAEQQAMARFGLVLTSQKASSSPRFPSVFHHVDGSFHEFVWRTFLFTVYSLVQHYPGITEEQLVGQLKRGGLISSTSCRVVLEFLKASLVVVTRRILLPCDVGVQGPFDLPGDRGCQQHECYFCTVSQDGPWRMAEL